MTRDLDRVFLIAEAGVNHNGSVERALAMVDAAAQAGADAVKFQTFRADDLAADSAPVAAYQARAGGAGSQHELLRSLELDREAHRALAERCRARAIEFMSSAFSVAALQMLVDEIGVAHIKIPSGEIDNPLILLESARTGRPVILSTGMSTLGDIEQALGVLAFGYSGAADPPGRDAFERAYARAMPEGSLAERVTLLHCTTQYPAPDGDMNLRAMDTLRQAFGLRAGLSDHSSGIAIALAAAARGASVIEKHFTLDRGLPGPDHAASVTPQELSELVSSVRRIERALGTPRKGVAASERENIRIARRSLVAARPIRRGEQFSAENLAVKRPAGGVSPMNYWQWLGRTAARDYRADELIDP